MPQDKLFPFGIIAESLRDPYQEPDPAHEPPRKQKLSPMLKFFEYHNLPPELRIIAHPISNLAGMMDSELPEGSEKSAGLRKLVEAMDCFIRAAQ